jgi:hypothetical protein
MADTPALPDLATQKAIFKALVEREDSGMATSAALAETAAAFELTKEAVRAISDRGADENWPPLEPCDDDE